jgi:transposase
MVSPADQFVVAHAEFIQWRMAHPHATLAEIEARFDQAFSALRSTEIARTAVADVPHVTPVCPDCQRPMQRHGVRTRHLVTRDEGQLDLPLPRYRCSVCGTELSPPG